LIGAFVVNPYDSEEIALSLEMVVNQTMQDRMNRMQTLYSFVANHSAERWAYNFLSLLKKSKVDHSDSYFIKMGFGLNW